MVAEACKTGFDRDVVPRGSVRLPLQRAILLGATMQSDFDLADIPVEFLPFFEPEVTLDGVWADWDDRTQVSGGDSAWAVGGSLRN